MQFYTFLHWKTIHDAVAAIIKLKTDILTVGCEFAADIGVT